MQSIDESIVIELFEFNIFSLEDKKYFLSEFVPFLSLKKLKDLGIINQEEAVKIIKKELLAL
jgi:hypothetical protein